MQQGNWQAKHQTKFSTVAEPWMSAIHQFMLEYEKKKLLVLMKKIKANG